MWGGVECIRWRWQSENHTYLGLLDKKHTYFGLFAARARERRLGVALPLWLAQPFPVGTHTIQTGYQCAPDGEICILFHLMVSDMCIGVGFLSRRLMAFRWHRCLMWCLMLISTTGTWGGYMYTTLALQFLNWASAIMNYYGVAPRYCLSFARSPAVVINLWKPLKVSHAVKSLCACSHGPRRRTPEAYFKLSWNT